MGIRNRERGTDAGGEKRGIKRKKTIYHSASCILPHICYILLYYLSIILAICAALLLLLCLTHLLCPSIVEKKGILIFSCPEATRVKLFLILFSHAVILR